MLSDRYPPSDILLDQRKHGDKVVYVDLTVEKATVRELEKGILTNFMGGRGLASKIIYDKCGATVDPFSPENVLIFSIGPLTGTMAPSSGRTNVSAKSPLTGIIGRSNAGGHWGAELHFAGYIAIIISGRANKPTYLWINNDHIELKDATHIWGKSIPETDKVVREETDEEAKIASIGIAGENLVRYASVFFDIYRVAGRTGMGTVMGSKNLKAVAVRGTKGIKIAQPDLLYEIASKIDSRLKKDSGIQLVHEFGSPGWTSMADLQGWLPTKNWQMGCFKDTDEISGETLKEKYIVQTKGCFSCPVHCRIFHVVGEGPYAGTFGSGPEYESIAAMGSRVCVNDLAAICYAHDLCNRLGLDVISTGQAISFAMECYEKGILTEKDLDGLKLDWGNVEAVIGLINKIARREGIGKILAEGTRRAAQKIGKGSQYYAMEIKGMELSGIDIRACKGYALAYAVATRGADHLTALCSIELCGNLEEGKRRWGSEKSVNRLSEEGKAPMVIWHEHMCSLCDSMTFCKYPTVSMCSLDPAISVRDMADLFQAVVGIRIDPHELLRIGERIINVEKAYNIREGCGSREFDSLPQRILKEPSPCLGNKGHTVNLEPMKDEYYELRGWDKKTSYPTRQKLKELNLGKLIKDIYG